MSEDWSTDLQKKVNMVVSDIVDDFKDGVLLINLMEILTNEKFDNYHISKPKNRLQQLSNVQIALSAVERWGINLVNVRPENLVDRNSKMILALLWRIISKFHIQQFLNEEDLDPEYGEDLTSSSKNNTNNQLYKTNSRGSSNLANFMKTPREALLRWCRRELEPYSLIQPVTNFTKSFQNPQVFYALVHRQAPSSIDLNEMDSMDDLAGLKRCFDIAEKALNIPSMLIPQSIIDGQMDESCTMTYVAYYLNLQRNGGNLTSIPSMPNSARGHNRSSSTGSNTSNSSVTSGGQSLGSSDNKLFFKRPPLKRQDTLTQTPEKGNPFSLATNGTGSNASGTPLADKLTQIGSPSQQQQQTPRSPREASSFSTADRLSLMEILNNFTQELRRISNDHEEMLKKAAAKLDERVNKLGDKLDQLELKITDLKSVVGMANTSIPTITTTTTTTTTNNNSNNSTPLITSIQSLDTSIDSPNNGSTSSTPPIGETRDRKKSVTKRTETKEERDERREKRRSRRREREDRKKEKEVNSSNNNPTLTQSSSSCSLADEAQVDREDLKKIIKAQSVVRAFLARRSYKRLKNRRDVALEILHTEKTYINSLQILAHEYLVPLRKMSEGLNVNIDNIKTLYNNIEVILNINNSLLTRIHERVTSKPWHCHTLFGDIFFKMSDLLKCYIAYVNHYNRSLNTVNEFTKHSTLYEFMNATFQRTNQQLRDLIIIPVQRIPRYVLLLEEMVKVTEQSHPDRTQLVQSLSKMQNIADHVNEKRREFENVTHVSMLQDAIIGFDIMAYPSLRYTMEGDLQYNLPSSGSGFGNTISSVVSNAVTGSSSDLKGAAVATILHVFLFNQMLVICKYKKGKDSYFSKHLYGTVDRKSKQPKYKYVFNLNLTSETKLSHNKSECWFGIDNQTDYKKFMAKTVAEKDMWIQHIQSCITKATENKKSKDNKS
ncbi:RhoGEF domain-containing protein [Heterostelium album PN500]|uniref:RhoGEF domain-containing protein n=1 Tax=Heterostelium pallidum (strain ATCC 26659 / Pp 5 / PN500) TaxID=670386 RepID=D3BSB6_HETP5|nr:RhoGEF domain-containing protein [Heterostelium album PN500]EFA75689.1 RhoGEF domain-containing protein [Heterostelium album PN500]|eukprot:XP_020427823.1 RhoGEF domain-containing protein [Heterostelium album PN500]